MAEVTGDEHERRLRTLGWALAAWSLGVALLGVGAAVGWPVLAAAFALPRRKSRALAVAIALIGVVQLAVVGVDDLALAGYALLPIAIALPAMHATWKLQAARGTRPALDNAVVVVAASLAWAMAVAAVVLAIALMLVGFELVGAESAMVALVVGAQAAFVLGLFGRLPGTGGRPFGVPPDAPARRRRPLVISGAFLSLVAVVVGTLVAVSYEPPIEIVDHDALPLADRRELHGARLLYHGPSPQLVDDDHMIRPDDVQEVHYASAGRALLAWYRPASQAGAPAIVYCHGGFAFDATDWATARPFVDAGFTVLTPSWRGESGNPGDFELWWGELDDVVAAIRWLAQQPGVDARRIYVFGHSAGGILASLVSVVPGVPVALTGSAGGLYPEDFFVSSLGEIAPFDVEDAEARRLRVLHPHLAQMVRPHIAFVGLDDDIVATFSHRVVAELGDRPPPFGGPAKAALSARFPLLEIVFLPGDHHSSREPAIEAFIARVRAAPPP